MKNESFKIQGLDRKRVLNGSITISGAKNAVLKAIAASVLFDDTVTLSDVPYTEDVKKIIKLLEESGSKIDISKLNDGKIITIDNSSFKNTNLNKELTQSMRASVVLTGPILAKHGKVSFSVPGGCVIGSRPIDLFINGYKKMGVEIVEQDDTYIMTAKDGRLHGAEIFFNFQTVGGTETLMMAAVLAKGKTILKNCAMEPEIVSVAEYLNSCGAKINGAGTTTITIEGVDKLNSNGNIYNTLPDRIETGSYLILGALCADNLRVEKCNPQHIESLTSLLIESGIKLDIGKDYIEIKNNSITDLNKLKSFNVRTHEYPGFPTDLQSPIVTYLTQVNGESTVFESIFEDRFRFTQNLIKLGAKITNMNSREILIHGNSHLNNMGGENLDAFDIRAGFASIIASLVAKGESIINNVYYIDRGYENILENLNRLGAKIERIKN